MLRTMAWAGMGGGFLMISPSLRGTVMGAFAAVVGKIEANSPYSYVALGVALLLGLGMSFKQGSRPR